MNLKIHSLITSYHYHLVPMDFSYSQNHLFFITDPTLPITHGIEQALTSHYWIC